MNYEECKTTLFLMGYTLKTEEHVSIFVRLKEKTVRMARMVADTTRIVNVNYNLADRYLVGYQQVIDTIIEWEKDHEL